MLSVWLTLSAVCSFYASPRYLPMSTHACYDIARSRVGSTAYNYCGRSRVFYPSRSLSLDVATTGCGAPRC